MDKEILLSICIPTRNRPKELAATLKALLAQLRESGAPGVAEIVVSDNTDDEALRISPDELKDGAIRYVRNEGNLGYARNINSLIGKAAGKYVWLLSDDDFVQAGAVAGILACLGGQQEINYLTFFTGAAFEGKVFDENFYFKDLGEDYFPAGDEFLAKYWLSIIFVSCNVFDREKMLRHAAANGLFNDINDVYQNSLLCISFISRHGSVKVVKKTLLIDNYGNKAYSRATAIEAPIHQYIKLWRQLAKLTGRRAVAPLLRDVSSSVLRHGLRFAVHHAEGVSDFDFLPEFLKVAEDRSLPFSLRARAYFVCALLKAHRKAAKAALKLISASGLIRLDYEKLKAEALAFEAGEKQQKMRSVY